MFSGFSQCTGVGNAAFSRMVRITGKVQKDGHTAWYTTAVPGNHSEARGTLPNTWGLVIAGGLVLLTSTLVCLLLFAA
jgi:hypothetical protein